MGIPHKRGLNYFDLRQCEAHYLVGRFPFFLSFIILLGSDIKSIGNSEKKLNLFSCIICYVIDSRYSILLFRQLR